MNRNLSQETKHNGHTSHEQKGRQSHWKGGNFSSELKPIQLTDFQTVRRIISPDERLPPPKPQMVVFYRFQTVTHVWVVTSNAIIYSTHQPPITLHQIHHFVHNITTVAIIERMNTYFGTTINSSFEKIRTISRKSNPKTKIIVTIKR